MLRIDNTSVRQQQIQRIQRVKAERDAVKVQQALFALTESAKQPQSSKTSNLLKLSIEAARVRATLGEISSALESVWGRHQADTRVVQGAYASSYSSSSNSVGAGSGKSGESEYEKEYKDVVADIAQFEKKEGRRPRILVAKMGQDGHDRGAKVIASGFSDLGYDVDVGPLFSTPEEVAQQAIDADVHVIGVSSQAAGHKTLIPALLKALEKQGGANIKVICGGVIPPQDYDFLYKQGVVGIFGPGTRIPHAAKTVLQAIQK